MFYSSVSKDAASKSATTKQSEKPAAPVPSASSSSTSASSSSTASTGAASTLAKLVTVDKSASTTTLTDETHSPTDVFSRGFPASDEKEATPSGVKNEVVKVKSEASVTPDVKSKGLY